MIKRFWLWLMCARMELHIPVESPSERGMFWACRRCGRLIYLGTDSIWHVSRR